MEKLINEAVLEDVNTHICLYGFNEETEVSEEIVLYPQGHIESRCKKVEAMQRTYGLSLSGALSLNEITPAEWGLMQMYFAERAQ